MNYDEFIKSKQLKQKDYGFKPLEVINSLLFDFQKEIVKWAIKKGKCAVFADCGLGKTFIQLEWAKQIYTKHPDSKILIIAPLAVSKQTKKEGLKISIKVNICRDQKDIKKGINIINYEILHKFDSNFDAVILDESSILKSFSSKTRNDLIEKFKDTKYKLCCTATPSPNDFVELGNHAEFLDIIKRTEMLAMFFVHDGKETQKWRLKGHAEEGFWEWLSSFCIMFRKPSDLGFKDDDFNLKDKIINEIIIDSNKKLTDSLFQFEALDLNERRQARKISLPEKLEYIKKYSENKPCLIWCDLNLESEFIKNNIKDCVEIKGANTIEYKEEMMEKFTCGEVKCLVTKPSIAGFGMNWQHCNNMIFVGLNDSFESYYQAIRRCWRFGQKKDVNINIIITNLEKASLRNIKRKEDNYNKMINNMIKKISLYNISELKNEERIINKMSTENKNKTYHIYNDDCINVLKKLEDKSIDYSIFSPPFAELYVYSDDIRDMGNSKNYDDFFKHFDYLVEQLNRIIKDGRLISVHCMDIPQMKERNGYIGLKDFPGDIIRMFLKYDFIYHSKHIIWKDPLIEATRTKAIGLMHKQVVKDSSMCRAGLPDYLLTFRKKGINKEFIKHENGFESFVGENEPQQKGIEYSHNVWRKYASPIWADINQTNTLQKTSAREEKDEKHICPLQLDVIERALELWSNENDLVLSPFMGIGSEGFCAVKQNRRFLGIELKDSYYKQALKNLEVALKMKKQMILI